MRTPYNGKVQSEYILYFIPISSVDKAVPLLYASVRLADDRLSTQKALQTVAAGQQAENLLDFDDSLGTEGQPSGLAATEVLSSTPAAANLLAGTSSNPLDDLVSIFGGMGVLGPSAGNTSSEMGLGGLPLSRSTFGFPIAPAPPSNVAGLGASTTAHVTSPVQSQQPEEDLLGLF